MAMSNNNLSSGSSTYGNDIYKSWDKWSDKWNPVNPWKYPSPSDDSKIWPSISVSTILSSRDSIRQA